MQSLPRSSYMNIREVSKMTDNLKTAVTLFLITLISGLMLGGVYEITKEPIERANNAAIFAAYGELIPGSVDYETEEEAVKLANEKLADGTYGKSSVDNIVAAKDADGNVMGYVVTSTSNEGYGGPIQLTIGYMEDEADGSLKSTGISFLSIAETAGLGMNAEKPEFKDQFIGKPAVELKLTKSGNAGSDEINAMSGATVTSTAVTNAVNAANYAISDCISK